jgi:hypothetical protein
MSNRLLGTLGVLWGGGILLFGLLGGGKVEGKGAYAAGQTTGWLFGLLLFLGGIYYLAKSPSKSPK